MNKFELLSIFNSADWSSLTRFIRGARSQSGIAQSTETAARLSPEEIKKGRKGKENEKIRNTINLSTMKKPKSICSILAP